MRTIQPSFAAGELAPSLAARTDISKYHVGARTMKNFFVHPHGGASNRPGTEYIGEAVGPAKFIPFKFSVVQAYVLVFTHLKLRVVKDNGFVVSSGTTIYEIASPYSYADLAELRYTQSADTVYFAHPSYRPYSLTRTDHNAWAFTMLSFASAVSAPTGLALAVNSSFSTGGTTGMTFKYKVSAVVDGEESLPGTEATQEVNNLYWPQGGQISLSWNAVTGADYYRVYKNYRGYYGVAGEAESTSFIDDNVDPDLSDGPQVTGKTFSSSGDYPGVVGIFQQRLFYGRSNNQPQTLWGSQTGLFKNFSVSRPLKDTDAIEVTLSARQVNAIQHLLPMQSLQIFTSGGEWIFSARDGEGISPINPKFDIQGYRGTGSVPPLPLGETAVFLQRGGSVVRDMAYALEVDGYTGNNISVLANHLFKDHKVIAWTYQQDPDSVVWAVRDDGVLVGLTYLKEHEVWAWHRHETEGSFIDVCSIPSASGGDEVYFLIKRTVEDVDHYYVEKLAKRLENDDINKAKFLDSGLAYEGSSTDTFSGLDHLEGMTVNALADGNVVSGLVVESGSVTLPRPASTVFIGLPYVCDLETLDVDFSQNSANVQGARKRIHKVIVRLENSRELFIGQGSDSLVEMKIRAFEDYGAPIELFTGDKEVVLSPKWDRTGRVFMRVVNPVPVTVLAVIPEVTIGS